jgi:hypothetical protein
MGIKHCLGPEERVLKELIRGRTVGSNQSWNLLPPFYDLRAGAILYTYILQVLYIKIISANLPDLMEDPYDCVVWVIT